ncbi:HAD-IA family hydrolase [bacterium]|nr:HAD-IA family hydrolase [bacterium]
MQHFGYYIFDLDGTLTDSSFAIGNGVVRALEQMGIAGVPLEDVRRWIGRPLSDIWTGYAEERGMRFNFSEAYLMELAGHYRQGHDEHFPAGVVIYPGVVETLQALRTSGAGLAVATTKWEEAAKWVTDGVGLTSLVDAVCGTDPGKPVKPDPYVIEYAIERISADPARTAVIGDTADDVAAGHAAGCTTIAVDYGFGDLDLIEQAGPDAVISELRELIAHD